MARSVHLLSGAVLWSILGQSTAALAVDCFVASDATGGDGTTEATAVANPADIPADCTVVKFKRGSEFKLAKGVANLGLPQRFGGSAITTLTNYGDASLPLPKFVKVHEDGSGGMLQMFGAVTIDGLYLAGSKSADSMGQLADGIGVMLFEGSTLINSEITLCDIGAMTSGDNVKVLNNYIHDLSISVDDPAGVDPNQVGGAEGIFVNSSNVEVAYNTFVNCTSQAEWVTLTPDKPRCDGGATEVTVPYAGEVTNVMIHHNVSYNSCGFFEVSSMPNPDDPTGSGELPYTKGKFTNSIFHNNVMVDSGWISLLQINNTRLTNVTWANNTIVHHYLPTVTGLDGNPVDLNDFGSSYIQAIAFNSWSSGVDGGGVLEAGDVYWKNNLWYFEQEIVDSFLGALSPLDSTHTTTDEFLSNIEVSGDKFFTTDPGFVNAAATTEWGGFDLRGTATEVIDQGEPLSDITTDFFDRPAPVGAALDLGAFEYQGESAGGAPGRGGAPGSGGIATDGGTTSGSDGGTTSASEGGAVGVAGAGDAGGAESAGGATPVSRGGAVGAGGDASAGVASGAGGKASTSTGGMTSASGGLAPTAGSPADGGEDALSTGGDAVASVGGQAGGAPVTTVADAGEVGDPDGDSGGSAAENLAKGPDDSGCGCRTAGRSSTDTVGAVLVALGATLLRRSRRRQV